MFHPKQSPGTSTPVPTFQIPTRSRVDNNMDIVIAVVVVIVVILIVAGETLVRALHLHVCLKTCAIVQSYLHVYLLLSLIKSTLHI